MLKIRRFAIKVSLCPAKGEHIHLWAGFYWFNVTLKYDTQVARAKLSPRRLSCAISRSYPCEGLVDPIAKTARLLKCKFCNQTQSWNHLAMQGL